VSLSDRIIEMKFVFCLFIYFLVLYLFLLSESTASSYAYWLVIDIVLYGSLSQPGLTKLGMSKLAHYMNLNSYSNHIPITNR